MATKKKKNGHTPEEVPVSAPAPAADRPLSASEMIYSAVGAAAGATLGLAICRNPKSIMETIGQIDLSSVKWNGVPLGVGVGKTPEAEPVAAEVSVDPEIYTRAMHAERALIANYLEAMAQDADPTAQATILELAKSVAAGKHIDHFSPKKTNGKKKKA